MNHLYALLDAQWQLIMTTSDIANAVENCNTLIKSPRVIIFHANWNNDPMAEPYRWSLYSSPARDLDVQLLAPGDTIELNSNLIRGYNVKA